MTQIFFPGVTQTRWKNQGNSIGLEGMTSTPWNGIPRDAASKNNNNNKTNKQTTTTTKQTNKQQQQQNKQTNKGA